MSLEEWGHKHQCQHCGALFYDMGREEPVCPACSKPHSIEGSLKLRRQNLSEQEAPAGSDEELALVTDIEVADDGEDHAILEDTSDLDSGDDVALETEEKEREDI